MGFWNTAINFVSSVAEVAFAPVVELHKAAINLVAPGVLEPMEARPQTMDDMEGGVAEAQSEGGLKGADGTKLSAEQTALMEMPPKELHNAFASDPEGTWKTIASLPPQERNQVMQGLQMAIQEDNQLQSMLSNFMKSLHDTAKSQISNLRV